MGDGTRLSKELEQCLGGRVRGLLGKIMPAVDGKAAHIARPLAPGRERDLDLGRDAAGGAPDRQHRTSDFLARRARLLIVREVARSPGAAVLTSRAAAHGIVEEGAAAGE